LFASGDAEATAPLSIIRLKFFAALIEVNDYIVKLIRMPAFFVAWKTFFQFKSPTCSRIDSSNKVSKNCRPPPIQAGADM